VTFADVQEQQIIFNYIQDTQFPPSTGFSQRFWTGAVKFNSQNYFWFSHDGPTNFLSINQNMPGSGDCLIMEPESMGRGVNLNPTQCLPGTSANVICEGFH
jgi:hypothetical protein